MEPELALRDIHLPEAVSAWPPAIGWWLLPLVLILVVYLLFVLYRRLTRRTAVKQAQCELLEIRRNPPKTAIQALQQYSVLLRRVALSACSDPGVAGLSGVAWLNYLDQSIPGQLFTLGPGRFLGDAHFRSTVADDLDILKLSQLCEQWIKAQQ